MIKYAIACLVVIIFAIVFILAVNCCKITSRNHSILSEGSFYTSLLPTPIVVTRTKEKAKERDLVVREIPSHEVSKHAVDYLKGEKCVICMDKFCVKEFFSLLPCEHLFHTNCIEQWLKVNLHTFCPLCKSIVLVDDLKLLREQFEAVDDDNVWLKQKFLVPRCA